MSVQENVTVGRRQGLASHIMELTLVGVHYKYSGLPVIVIVVHLLRPSAVVVLPAVTMVSEADVMMTS